MAYEAATRLVVGAGQARRFAATVLPRDVTLDKVAAAEPDILADFSKRLEQVQGAPYKNVLFERFPTFSLTPEAAENASKALGAGGRVEILTGFGTSAPKTIASVENLLRNAGFSDVSGELASDLPGDLVRVVGIKR